MAKSDFEKKLLIAVDYGLLALGENNRTAIYYHLEKSFRLEREKISNNPEEFSQALHSIFGPGAEVIEKFIIKDLYSRLGLNFEEETSSEFIDCVRRAQKNLGSQTRSFIGNIKMKRGGKFE